MTPYAMNPTQRAIHNCPNCNPTARAIQWVINKWIEAGINRGE